MYISPLRFVFLLFCVACQPDASDVADDPTNPTDPNMWDAIQDREHALSPDTPLDCGFNYAAQFGQTTAGASEPRPIGTSIPWVLTDRTVPVAHPEPLPPYTWNYSLTFSTEGLTLPGYSDNMPIFERSLAWERPVRCFETPNGASFLTEDQAYDLYLDIAEFTTGVTPNTANGIRTVVGLRGAFPGTFTWHGNAPNQFNDTLVLLWRDGSVKHVREFPVNTDTGAVYFGYHSASSLRPNRRYTYSNGWHRKYNAPSMHEWSYRVADDSNGNGHWDRDRNGWLSGGAEDHERNGGAHNIHMASVDGPLGKARIQNWSAGCQVIPGMENWLEFIGNYWTGDDDKTDYFLIDVRDIDHRIWSDCTPDGSHDCPIEIPSFPFKTDGDTHADGFDQFDRYNCSTADESGPETVYFFTVDRKGTLSVAVESLGGSDIDIHLLDGDDANACLARDHTDFTYSLTPGRYYIIADSWVDGSDVLAGSYELKVTFK